MALMIRLFAINAVIFFIAAVKSLAFSSSLPLLRHALRLSQAANQNITAAHEACAVWQKWMETVESSNDDDNDDDGTTVVPLYTCHALHAACLVRVGKDSDALEAYRQAGNEMLLLQEQTSASSADMITLQWTVGLGQARALQRLLRYDEAVVHFQRVLEMIVLHGDGDKNNGTAHKEREITLASALMGAVTCYARRGQYRMALQLVESISRDAAATVANNPTVDVVSQLLSYLTSDDDSGDERENLVSDLLTSVAQENGSSSSNGSNEDMYPVRCRFNIGPWDDPWLEILDDKVALHRLLTSSSAMIDGGKMKQQQTDHFWPPSFESPSSTCTSNDGNDNDNDKAATLFYDTVSPEQPWLAKRKAGYGSHGNSIVTKIEDKQRCDSEVSEENTMNSFSESILIQKIVEPQLLIRKRRFSLRVYLVYFMSSPGKPPRLYLLPRQGLVKLAALPAAVISSNREKVADNPNHPDRVMTNSGRGVDMEQYDWVWLEHELGVDNTRTLWTGVTEAVKATFSLYHSKTIAKVNDEPALHVGPSSEQLAHKDRRRLAKLGLPKVLGLDFVADENLQAWLVEVNRFPGLEARNEQDRTVKRAVLELAWTLRHNMGKAASGCGDDESYQHVPLDC